jgi:thymidylate synthase ThyX
MTTKQRGGAHPRRVYPLDAHQLTEEQIAVAFAMTSRRPEPFDEIARQVSQEKAADFHERWVLGYGHASVAEHAVVHLAVENISRLACDALEDNRLASYTEKSSRYQVMLRDYFHLPEELKATPELANRYHDTCQRLFQDYLNIIDGCMSHLRLKNPKGERESDSGYNLRLRRIATDSCRAVLPAATLTNVGVTANARVLEHAVSKLMSSGIAEERELGRELVDKGRAITPTLIKYADANPYLASMSAVQEALSQQYLGETPVDSDSPMGEWGRPGEVEPTVRLVHWDPEAEKKLAAAMLYRQSAMGYQEIWRRVDTLSVEEREDIIGQCLAGLGPHDAPVRELEAVDYTFEFVMDYGAYREFKRHRMMSYFPQPLTVNHGYKIPELIVKAGLKGKFQEAIGRVEDTHREIGAHCPVAAQYLVTHAHYRRVAAKMNLRECFHLFKLRTSQLAHFAIRAPVLQAMKLAVDTHPGVFRRLVLRDYPDWWPFPLPV